RVGQRDPAAEAAEEDGETRRTAILLLHLRDDRRLHPAAPAGGRGLGSRRADGPGGGVDGAQRDRPNPSRYGRTRSTSTRALTGASAGTGVVGESRVTSTSQSGFPSAPGTSAVPKRARRSMPEAGYGVTDATRPLPKVAPPKSPRWPGATRA